MSVFYRLLLRFVELFFRHMRGGSVAHKLEKQKQPWEGLFLNEELPLPYSVDKKITYFHYFFYHPLLACCAQALQNR